MPFLGLAKITSCSMAGLSGFPSEFCLIFVLFPVQKIETWLKKVKTKCAKKNSLANFVRFVRPLLYAALERRRIASNKMTSIFYFITFSVVAFSVLCLITIKVKQKTKYQNKSELMLIY